MAAVAGSGIAGSTRVSHPDRERSEMSVEWRVDDLIAAGLRPLGLDFGLVALQHWRRKVLDCMTAVYGRITSTLDFPKTAFAKTRTSRRKTDGN